MLNGFAVAPCVHFDDRGAKACCHLDGSSIRLDKERHADTGVFQLLDEGLEMIMAANDIEAALCRSLGPLFGHEADGMGFDAQGNAEHLGRCGHFEIQRLCDFKFQARHILVADVTAIFPQMGGNAVGTAFNRHQSGAHGIGGIAAPRIADCRDVINIQTKTKGRNGSHVSDFQCATARLCRRKGSQFGR